ncbi:hypothetical protein [uncultured Alistipes sp.]|jgi:lipoprotein|uniref:hypothetical protein n=1 Tax=uncultured Alistipes sp. TaxID=538949 RepID=UPI0025DFA56F|nr:hypothetical protein [uncultured Alistipes sp.]
MKKLFFIFTIAALSFATACSDDDKKGSSELVGTKWIYEEGSLLSSFFWQEDITFNSASSFTYHYMELSYLEVVDEGQAKGKYTYTPPTLTGNITMDGVKVNLRGEVSGKNMSVYVNGELAGIYKLDE